MGVACQLAGPQSVAPEQVYAICWRNLTFSAYRPVHTGVDGHSCNLWHGVAVSTVYIVLAGVIIGILISAPVGPVNAICIQRAATRGFGAGMLSGMGSVTGDGIFAAIAAFGVTTITQMISGYASALHFVGGVFLFVFGLKLIFWPARKIVERAVPPFAEHAGLFGTTFALTMTNPATLFGTIALFGGAGALLPSFDNYSHTWLLVISVMAGSTLWWAALSALIATFRHKLSDRALQMINAGSGLVCLGFGLFILGRLADNMFFSAGL